MARLNIYNYGKCHAGDPWHLTIGCKELLATATPKADPPCEVENCDAQHHSRKLTWFVKFGPRTWSAKEEEIDCGCAVISPGPSEMLFNRTITKNKPGECWFELWATIDEPTGMSFASKPVTVVVD